jgi:hypothetical protein
MTSTNVPPEFICPLTLEIMTEPVMTRLGHNFELSALLKWLDGHEVCPLTRNPMTLKDIIVNRALKANIRAWRKVTGQEDKPKEFDQKLPLVLSLSCHQRLSSRYRKKQNIPYEILYSGYSGGSEFKKKK